MLLENWNEELKRVQPFHKDIYFTEEYCRLYNSEQRKAAAFSVKIGQDRLLMPIMLGEIPGMTGFYDFETPYGYGGPIATNNDPEFWKKALSILLDEMRMQNIVCGLIRYHPLLGNEDSAKVLLPSVKDRKTVIIDLRPNENEIWEAQVHSKNRNAIRKAEMAGLEFTVDDDFSELNNFINIYESTMKRLGAATGYLFGPDYYNGIKTELMGNSFIGMVRSKGTIIAAAIFLYQIPWGHYHLSGSTPDARLLSANNFLVYRGALELKRRGVEVMHLGGGTDSQEKNSLLAFKQRFSPNNRWFSIGKVVLNAEKYKILGMEWEKKFPEKVGLYGKYLLKYRM
ncbi:GNAT family N-acetyltransferase [Methanomethylovorans sp.]|jgi:hypothetical protein|uniref:GNAT family N-acetyltransferase n=1 Tax=Methanomethylovorans sp. TaxID=2758717 RepID=UPI003D140D0C